MRDFKNVRLFVMFIILSNANLFQLYAQDNRSETAIIPVTSWLVQGPVPVSLPVLNNEKNLKNDTFTLKNLLEFESFEISAWQPEEGEPLRWSHGAVLRWIKIQTDTSGLVLHSFNQSDSPEMAFIGSYFHTKRYCEIKLHVSSAHRFIVFIDGENVLSKTEVNTSENDSLALGEKLVKSVTLETGSHLLLIKTLRDSGDRAAWTIRADLELPEKVSEKDVSTDTNPDQPMNFSHLLDGPKSAHVSVSPNGDWALVLMQAYQVLNKKSEYWLELWNIQSGEKTQSYRGYEGVSRVTWSPNESVFSFVSSENNKSTLWQVDIESGKIVSLLQNVEDLNTYAWSPTGTTIIYSITEKYDDKGSDLNRIDGMPDRWPWFRDRHFLYRLHVPGGVKERLTAGKLTSNLQSIHPNGNKIIFSREVIDFSGRPYSQTVFYLMDLSTFNLDTLWISRWINQVSWSPDGNILLVLGGPSAFESIGKNVSEGMIPNEYDQQAFLYDLRTNSVQPISRDFNPAIQQAEWDPTGKSLYFLTTHGSYRHLYRYDVSRKQYEMIPAGVDIVQQIDFSKNGRSAVYRGHGVSDPPKVYTMDLRRNRYQLLVDPEKETCRHVAFGNVEKWTFKHNNTEIEGRIYYPPNFDSSKKYPCIVYYYGGTSPVDRSFGGRYPKEIWAGQGYVVYVLQPSGSVGYGQEFSARHVNNWGITVADEIITGTDLFLNAHPFIDRNRIGCIGASYGGFMTMLLVTRTDMFISAVSHAGISSISSYWGEGFWGYSYSSTATANSFPWNRPDIYVDQSPLFQADKVNTPLLLLHGEDDTNVPPGESRQFYTALKLLGKEVELIEIKGQNHLIMEYDKRKAWSKTIIAWFDRWLKNQPEWWDKLYPSR